MGLCKRCGTVITGSVGPNTKYCSFCKVDVEREKCRKRVQKHRENKDIEELRERNRQHIKSYRERWGWSNKSDQLGSGRLSPKRNQNFEIELKLIQWEKRRLGVK